MWVCRQKHAANAVSGSIATSSHSTDHAPSAKTMNHIIGRYGFHAWVSTDGPKKYVSTASTAATPSRSRVPPRRRAITRLRPSASAFRHAVAACMAHADEPNSL